MATATPRTVAQAITEALRNRPDVTEAYVSASSPEWSELFIHVYGGQSFYVRVSEDTDQ